MKFVLVVLHQSDCAVRIYVEVLGMAAELYMSFLLYLLLVEIQTYVLHIV